MKITYFFILFMSAFAMSQAGNIIKLCEGASPFTIIYYRLLIAMIFLLPLGIKKIRDNLYHCDTRVMFKVLLMGVIFAFHLFFWVRAIECTKVTNAVICYSTLPVFISLGAYLVWREQLHKNIVIAIITGLLGVFLVGYDDFSTETEYLLGDILAMVSALLFAVYFLIGKSVRATKDNSFVMFFVYLFSSYTSFFLTQWTNSPLTGFSLQTWIAFAMLAIIPTLMGHAVFIYSSKFFPASVTSTFILLEPVFAGLVAYLLHHERITWLTAIGYVWIIIGLGFLIWAEPNQNQSPTPATHKA